MYPLWYSYEGYFGQFAKASFVRTRLLTADFVAVLATCLAAAWGASRYGWEISVPFLGLGAKVITPTVVVLWLAALGANGSWDVRLVFAGTEYYVRVLRSTLIAFAGTGLVGFIGSVDAARPFVLFAFPTGTVVIIANRWFIRAWAREKAPIQRVVIVGSNHSDTHSALVADSAMRIQVVDSRESVSSAEISEWCGTTSADVVVIGANHGLSQYELRELMWYLDEEGIAVWFDAASQFIRSGKGVMIPSKQTTLMVFDPVHLSDGQRLLKRSFDVVFALVALVVFVPVVVIGALAILPTMGRPLVFVQKRIGLDGKQFSLWKLRTMNEGESAVIPAGMSKNPDDPRVTPVGKVLRRWSIDEIPQFWNVLKGDMSVVGPRPRLPEEVVASSISSRRLRAKPGITGPWQTSGRSLMPFAEADALDVNYVDSWSLLGDVVIVLRTVRVVLSGRGAF
jgi:lipopolysaccharide/colanic/teichoic acid biosynthesis glycosyltransferase